MISRADEAELDRLLHVIVRLMDQLSDNQALDTESIAQALFDEARAEGRSASFHRSPPWFGLDQSLRELERRG
jgi:hypothetical protein